MNLAKCDSSQQALLSKAPIEHNCFLTLPVYRQRTLVAIGTHDLATVEVRETEQVMDDLIVGNNDASSLIIIHFTGLEQRSKPLFLGRSKLCYQ